MNVIEALKARLAADANAALKTYRDAVTATAAGEELSAKKVKDLGDALATLRLTADDLTADVAVYQRFTALTATAAKHPEIEKQAAKAQQDIQDHTAAIEQLQKKLNQARGDSMRLTSAVATERTALDDLTRTNPRLFADGYDPTPAPPKQPEVFGSWMR
jgi:chromosome segregation ATPase